MRAIILLLLCIYGCKADTCPETTAADVCLAQFRSDLHEFNNFTYIVNDAEMTWGSMCFWTVGCVVKVLDNCPKGPIWEPYLIKANFLEYFCAFDRFLKGLEFLQCANGKEAQVKSFLSTCFSLSGADRCALSADIKGCLITGAATACSAPDTPTYIEYANGIMERYESYYCNPAPPAAATTTAPGEQCVAWQGVSVANPSASTNKDCFDACAADPKCFQYTFRNGACSYQFSGLSVMNTVDNVDTYAYVSCECVQNCKSLKNQELLFTGQTTNQGCFQACTNDPRCFLYSYYNGDCSTYGAGGDVVDTVTNQDAGGFVYCTCDNSVVDTTTTAPSTRLCYTCQSGHGTAKCHACPADGDTAGWNRTKVVSCSGPCVKTTTQLTQGTHVERGCSDGMFPSTVIQPSGCVTYLDKNVCFCSGDRCNQASIIGIQGRRD